MDEHQAPDPESQGRPMDEEHWNGQNVAGKDPDEASSTDREDKSAGKRAHHGQPTDEPVRLGRLVRQARQERRWRNVSQATCSGKAGTSGIQRTIMVTSRWPVGWVHVRYLGLKRRPKLHDSQASLPGSGCRLSYCDRPSVLAWGSWTTQDGALFPVPFNPVQQAGCRAGHPADAIPGVGIGHVISELTGWRPRSGVNGLGRRLLGEVTRRR